MEHPKYKFCLIFLCICFANTVSYSQYITTIAGTGIAGYSGDGGPATAASVYLPIGLGLDSMGDIYFAENVNHIIRKVSVAGIISTYAGNGIGISAGDGGPATAASFGQPQALAIDKAGNVFVSDDGYPTIRKISIAGIITRIAGTGTLGYTGDGGPATVANICSPGDLAFDTLGNLYLTDAVHNVVRKIDTSGIISTIIGCGISGFTGDGGPATNARINTPGAVAADRKGNVYVSDGVNYRIRKVNTSGIITTIAGNGVWGFYGDGGPATAAEITYAEGLYPDKNGNLYLADEINNRIRKIDTNGIITTVAGGGVGGLGDGGPATAATLRRPWKITRKGDGNFYISDTYNQRIRMIITRPFYVNGPVQHLIMCHGTLGLDTALAASDSNSGNRETWRLIAGPHHGTATIGYGTISTGNTLYPAGQSYTSNPGYTGADTLVVLVTDSVISDTTTLYLNIEGPANAGVITGPDTVCRPSAITLTDTVSGGLWSAANSHATVTAGVVTGVTSGPDTIRYTTTNACGPTSATWVVQVKGCQVAVPEVSEAERITIFPNPTTGAFTLYLPASPCSVVVTDMMGRTVASFSSLSGRQQLPLFAPAGVYTVHVIGTAGGWTGRLAVVKE